MINTYCNIIKKALVYEELHRSLTTDECSLILLNSLKKDLSSIRANLDDEQIGTPLRLKLLRFLCFSALDIYLSIEFWYSKTSDMAEWIEQRKKEMNPNSFLQVRIPQLSAEEFICRAEKNPFDRLSGPQIGLIERSAGWDWPTDGYNYKTLDDFLGYPCNLMEDPLLKTLPIRPFSLKEEFKADINTCILYYIDKKNMQRIEWLSKNLLDLCNAIPIEVRNEIPQDQRLRVLLNELITIYVTNFS